MAMLMGDTQIEQLAPPTAGDKWVCVSARGAGVPVRVTKVTKLNVMFRTFGRGREHEVSTTLNYDAFMARYRPMSRVKHRQRELQRLERQQPSLRAEIAIGPEIAQVTPTEPESTLVTDNPATTAPVAGEAPRGPYRFQKGQAPMNPKLTPVQAVEIVDLHRQQHMPVLEIAVAYGVTERNIRLILEGKTWSQVTAEARARPIAMRPEPAPVTPPPPPEPPVAVATATPEPEESPVPVIPANRIAADIEKIQTLPIGSVELLREPTHRHDPLVAELADAAEVLLEYAGRPLPKFIQLDAYKIRGLIKQARGQV